MILCDVNVLVQSMYADAEYHALSRRALEGLVEGDDSLAVSEFLLAAVVRVSTNRRIFPKAIGTADAFSFVDTLREHRRAVVIAPGRRHWSIFRDLVQQSGVAGPDTTDAYIAALAIEHHCELWTLDRDFRRFAGLRQRNLRHAGGGRDSSP